jgi:hypothetical protein
MFGKGEEMGGLVVIQFSFFFFLNEFGKRNVCNKKRYGSRTQNHSNVI